MRLACALAVALTAIHWPFNSQAQVNSTAFPSGIYYGLPSAAAPQVRLTLLGGQAPAAIDIPLNGFDISDTQLVTTDNSTVSVVSPSGQTRTLTVPGLYFIARPSLSADGTRIAVQASASPSEPPQDLNIYVIDLQTGQPQRISPLAVNEESPEWMPGQNKVAYSSFAPTGIDIHVYDLDAARESLLIPGAGGIHLAISADGARILEPGRMRIYSAADGTQLADLRTAIVQALQAQGYEADDRYPGQANRGTLPLDGGFSADGQYIVFDGAVKKAGVTGVVLGRVTAAGAQLEILSGLITVNPAFSNNHNYSQLNPAYLKTPRTTVLGAVFSTAQTSAQSLLRFHNTGTSAGTATVTLRDSATGQSLGQWTSPSIPAGSQQQYYIGTIEAAALAPGTGKPDTYSLSVQTNIAGSFQHVIFHPGGVRSNLSTCASGVTADPIRLSAVNTSTVSALGFSSTVVVNNTGGTARAATLGIYDARNGSRLGTYVTAPIPANAHAILSVATIEAGANVTPSSDMFHYVIQAEGTFAGFLQHLVTNQRAGTVSDMTRQCALNGNSSAVASPLHVGSIFSTAQTSAHSLFRFYNTGTSAGTATVTLRDYATGQPLGQWTSPSIPAGSQQQYYIGTIEAALGLSTSRPNFYSMSVQSTLTGTFQHVLAHSNGARSNLSTCSSGVTADPRRLSAVNTSAVSALGFPSTVVVNNTGSSAGAVTLGIYDARNGSRMGTYVTSPIPANAQAALAVATIEAGANVRPAADMFHYVIQAEGPFTGFLQHLINNQRIGITTDMTTVCVLSPPS